MHLVGFNYKNNSDELQAAVKCLCTLRAVHACKHLSIR